MANRLLQVLLQAEEVLSDTEVSAVEAAPAGPEPTVEASAQNLAYQGGLFSQREFQ